MTDASVPAWALDRLRLFPGAISSGDCEKIVVAGDALALRQGALYNNDSGEQFYNPDVRLTSVGWLRERDWIYDLAHSFASQVNAEWGYDLNDADHLQYALYRKNDFFEWHKDMLRVRNATIRKVSVVVQLSDPADYRGGRLEFRDDDFGLFVAEAFVPQGSVAVFTSLLKHRVTPIKEGERRSLTAWFKGPAFR
jgi:PKHD-type hydroxylase